jgi:hypothetical protein
MTQEKRNELNIKLGQTLADVGTAYRNVQEWTNKLGEYDLSCRNMVIDIQKLDADLAKEKAIADQEARKEQEHLKLAEASSV